MQNRKPKQTSDRLFSARPLIELIFLVRVWGKSSPRGACHGDTPWTPARARARARLYYRERPECGDECGTVRTESVGSVMRCVPRDNK